MRQLNSFHTKRAFNLAPLSRFELLDKVNYNSLYPAALTDSQNNLVAILGKSQLRDYDAGRHNAGAIRRPIGRRAG
jgi:hypothetical protein